MQTYQALITQYQLCIEGRSTKEITRAEKSIHAFETEPDFLDSNVTVIMKQSLPYNLRKLAVIEMDHYARRAIENQNQTQLNNLLGKVFNIFGIDEVQYQFKELLVSTAIRGFNQQQSKLVRQKALSDVAQYLKNSVEKGDNYHFSYFVLSAKVFLKLRQSVFAVNSFVLTHFRNYLEVGLQLLKNITLIPSEDIKSITFNYSMMHHYTFVIKQMLKRVRLLDSSADQLLFYPELSKFIMAGFDLNHPSNNLDTPLIMIQEGELTCEFNKMKIELVQLLELYMRTVNGYVNSPEKINACPIIEGSIIVIRQVIRVLANVLSRKQLFNISSKYKILPLIEQFLRLLIVALRMTTIYENLFAQNKQKIGQEIIMQCLCLSNEQMKDFSSNPEEFAENAIYINNRDSPEVYRDKMVDEQEEEEQDKMLKAVAADLLISFCLHIDGVVTQIYDFSLNYFKGGSERVYPSYILFQVMAIARESLKNRKDLQQKIIELLTKFSEQNLSIQVMEDIHLVNFGYFLLFSSYAIQQLEQSPSKLIFTLLNQASNAVKSKWSCLHYFAYQLVETISGIAESEGFMEGIINFYTNLIEMGNTSCKLLQSYSHVIQKNGDFLQGKTKILKDMVNIVGQYMLKYLKQNTSDLHSIHLCFNILMIIGEDQKNLPQLIEPIENVIFPLIEYISGGDSYDFEGDILNIVRIFICFKEKVSPLQQKILNIIPDVYFKQYMECFGQSFETIQALAYYGSDSLKQSEKKLLALVELGVNSLNHPKGKGHSQTDFCQGVITLQSLILSCGQEIPPMILKTITQKLMKKVSTKNPFRFLQANVYSLLGLILLHRSERIPEEEGETILKKILTSKSNFIKQQYPAKLMIACLSKLLQQSNRDFITRNFRQILSMTIHLLSERSKKDAQVFTIINDDSQEQEMYLKIVEKVINSIKVLDEFKYFKQQLLKIKEKDQFKKVYDSMASYEKEFLSDMVRTELVKNTPRVIYRAKRE